MTGTAVFDDPSDAGHEAVHFHRDPITGLEAIIAVHSTALGPAAGGCRRWAYPSPGDGLRDVLRLSEAMTWKNALAGLPLGGGKAVILAPPGQDVTADELRAFGGWVQALDGTYWTAEDVGVGPAEVARIAETTDHVFGVDVDPSPHTAYGALMGIGGAVRHRLGRESLAGCRVAVQGLGNVGAALCRLLADAGAELVVTDVDDAAVRAVVDATGAAAVGPDAVYDAEVDVFAPCALGGVLNAATIPRLRATIVAGVANNQLAAEADAVALAARGIVHVPDFIVNSGGMLAASDPILGRRPDPERTRRLVADIEHRVVDVLSRADDEGRPPSTVAVAMAREIVQAA